MARNEKKHDDEEEKDGPLAEPDEKELEDEDDDEKDPLMDDLEPEERDWS